MSSNLPLEEFTDAFAMRRRGFVGPLAVCSEPLAWDTVRPQNILMYHVTLLSNFARAFDKYQRLYRKSAIAESTYPNEFYVLPASELGVAHGRDRRKAGYAAEDSQWDWRARSACGARILS
jgi:hypothetical protein